jgi:ABC-type Mn2+/Zn2+ transport system permease subunit
MQRLADGRRYRLQVAKSGMPPIMWGVLIAGGGLTVLFTYLFEVENAKAQILMTSLVTLALSLNIVLVVLLSNPYKGHVSLSSAPFSYDLQVIGDLLKLRPD